MKITTDILEKLKKYANNELDENERNSFEAILLKHPELQEELEFTKSLIKTTEKLEQQRVLSLIEKIDAQSKDPNSSTSIGDKSSRIIRLFTSKKTLFWLVVAVFILLIAGLWWVTQKSAVTPQQDKFQKFQANAYISLSAPGVLRGGNKSNLLASAFKEYEMSNYQESLRLLDDFLGKDSLYLKSLFLRGHCLYKLNRYEQAIQTFDEIQNLSKQYPKNLQPNPDNVEWTKLLSMLGKYRKEGTAQHKLVLSQAIQSFISTSNPKDSYRPKALELLKLLK